MDRYLSPRSEVDPSRAEEALRQALTASSKIEMQHRERIDDSAPPAEPYFGEESSHLGGGPALRGARSAPRIGRRPRPTEVRAEGELHSSRRGGLAERVPQRDPAGAADALRAEEPGP